MEAVLFGDFVFPLLVVPIRSKQGEIAIQILLEFVVEDDSGRSASSPRDSGSLLLIEAVEIGIVFDFSRLQQSVIDDLFIRELVRAREKAVAGFRERKHSQRFLLRDFDGLVGEQTLLTEVAYVLLHSLAISLVSMLRKVGRSDDAESADFLEGVQLRIAEQVGAVPHIVGARGVVSFATFRVAFLGRRHLRTFLRLGRCSPDVSAIRGCRCAPAYGAALRSLAGILRIVGEGVARHYFPSSSLAGIGIS